MWGAFGGPEKVRKPYPPQDKEGPQEFGHRHTLKKHKKCFDCTKPLSNVHLNKDLYCISCRDWFCCDCLSLPSDLLKKFLTTDLPFFCKECSIDFYVPYVLTYVETNASIAIVVIGFYM